MEGISARGTYLRTHCRRPPANGHLLMPNFGEKRSENSAKTAPSFVLQFLGKVWPQKNHEKVVD